MIVRLLGLNSGSRRTVASSICFPKLVRPVVEASLIEGRSNRIDCGLVLKLFLSRAACQASMSSSIFRREVGDSTAEPESCFKGLTAHAPARVATSKLQPLQTPEAEGMSASEQHVVPASSRLFDLPTLLFMLGAGIYLYPFLFAPHFVPMSFCGTAYVTDAKQMYEGDVMYRDFFQFSPPATGLVYLLLFKLFGLRAWILNAEGILLGVGLAWLGVTIAKKVMRPGLALLPAAIFLVGMYKNSGASDHHWYSLLTGLAGIAILMERRTPPRIAAAGCFGALSTCFTQTRGLAVTMSFAIYLWWESRQKREDWRALLRKEAWLAASFLATLIAVNGYFVWKAGLTRFLWCTVVFGIKYYPKDAEWNTFAVFFNELPPFQPLQSFIQRFGQWIFLNAAVPLTCILFFVRYWREPGKRPAEFWERPMLLALTSAGMLLSVAPAPEVSRLAASAFPAIILLVWFIDSPRKLARAISVVLLAGVVVVALHSVAGAESRQSWILTTRQGEIALLDHDEYEEYTWIQQHTRPSEYFYAPVWDPGFCVDIRNPTPLPFIKNNGYTTQAQVAEVVAGLDRHQVRYIYWSPGALDSITDGRNSFEDNLDPLRRYIHNHYRVVNVFTNADEIWERKDGAADKAANLAG